jgi:CheY-like chemotaxis protein
MGIEVVEAADDREALERLKEMSFPDLVLVD